MHKNNPKVCAVDLVKHFFGPFKALPLHLFSPVKNIRVISVKSGPVNTGKFTHFF